MTGLLDLPAECTIQILSLLAPPEIARCRLVSRMLWTIIHDSVRLQYLLELDCLRLVPRHTFSDRLSLAEKVRVVREKRRLMDSQNPGDSEVIPLCPTDYGNLTAPNFGSTYTYSRGVLVLKGQEDADQLGVYQLSSRNRNVESASYVLKSLPAHCTMAIEPMLDLLLLSSTTDVTATFHLRSLRTGLAHPNAALPAISHPVDANWSTRPRFMKTRIEIIGRRIAYIREGSEVFQSVITIWDWVSGQIVTSTKICGTSLTFLSEDVFIVANPIIGSLDKPSLVLYTCDGVPAGNDARLVATFTIPVLEFDDRSISWTEFLPSSQPSVWHNDLPIDSPPLIYDTCPISHYLPLRVSFTIASSYSCGMLFIHSSSLLALASNLDLQSNQGIPSVPWSKWKSAACWVGPHNLDGEHEYGPAMFGHLMMFMHPQEQLGSWLAEIYDLRSALPMTIPNPRPRKASYLPRDQEIESAFNGPPNPMQTPSVVKSFWIPFETIPWEKDWHETRYGTCPVEVMIDDEHVVIVRMPSHATQPRIHVYPL
ncbi:unnamed protein product [Rhizoctonia solani]|uniref:F-box domain-containing protein n=1 Tax=Rhizoctonia solani TaxID=456999 RepID=A0A8H3HEL4_9AGAM|nr:unnamed protein product [Rhizoctonia solani]